MKRKKNEEYRESQITAMNILGFYLLFKTLYFVRKHSLKKVVHTIKLYVQVLCFAGNLKRSIDTPQLIWICISV